MSRRWSGRYFVRVDRADRTTRPSPSPSRWGWRIAAAVVLSIVAIAAWRGFPFGPEPDAKNAAASALSVSFDVINTGTTAYNIDGVDNPTLALNRGETYVFNVSAIGHPFYIKT